MLMETGEPANHKGKTLDELMAIECRAELAALHTAAKK